LLPIDDPVNRCQLRPGAGKNSFRKSPSTAPRRVASSRASITAAGTLALRKRRLLICMAHVLIHAIRPFLTTTTSSRLPLPVPASIPELSFLLIPPVVRSPHQLVAEDSRPSPAKPVPDPQNLIRSGSYATEHLVYRVEIVRPLNENSMSYLSYTRLDSHRFELNGTVLWTERSRQRARWTVKRAPVSPGRLLALASPRWNSAMSRTM
jgi:hypothetical protein